MTDRSIQVWIVLQFGHEHDIPVKVWDDKRRAELHAKRLEETKETRKLPADFLGYRVQMVPMVTRLRP